MLNSAQGGYDSTKQVPLFETSKQNSHSVNHLYSTVYLAMWGL